MHKLTRFLTMTACLICTSTMAAQPSSIPTEEAVRTALAQHNLWSAGSALDQLAQSRLPSKDSGKPDSLLDRLYADYFAESGHLTAAGVILRRIAEDRSTPNLPHYRLLLATYYESVGAFEDAQSQYQSIVADPKASIETALSATLGTARLAMLNDPAGALNILTNIPSAKIPASIAWEVNLLLARSVGMADPSQIPEVTSALDRAWMEAPRAAVTSGAVARVANDRAILAGRNGDRTLLTAMLAVDRASRSSNDGQAAVGHDLPICGTEGIAPDDLVIVDVAHQPAAERPAITFVWANRPGIAQYFLRAAERSGALVVPDGQVASFGLRCRTSASPDYIVRDTLTEEISGWMAGRGAYVAANENDGTGLPSLATELTRREAKYGKNSVMLLPVLFRITTLSYVNFADPAYRKQASDSANHIATILQENRAPALLSIMWRIGSLGAAVSAQITTPADGNTQIQELLLKAAKEPTLPLDTLYTFAVRSAETPNVPTDFKMTMLSRVLDLLKSKAGDKDPRTVAIAVRLHQMRQANGDAIGAKSALMGIAAPAESCDLSYPLPHYVSSNIVSEDYPGDLVFMTMPGRSYVEFSLDSLGQAQNGRILLSDPPFAFDQIASARIPTIRYDPARVNGRASACIGMTQAIRWQVPNADAPYGM